MADFDELFEDVPQPPSVARIVPFSFQCANYTDHGKKLQQFFKHPTNEQLYDDVKKMVEKKAEQGITMNLYVEYGRRGGEFIDAPRQECPVSSDDITIKDSCILPCGHVFSKQCIIDWNTSERGKGRIMTCPKCRQTTNVAYEMCEKFGNDYGPISGGKRKTMSKNKKHKVRKSRKLRKSRRHRKSFKKH
jgi:hypothetical protein